MTELVCMDCATKATPPLLKGLEVGPRKGEIKQIIFVEQTESDVPPPYLLITT